MRTDPYNQSALALSRQIDCGVRYLRCDVSPSEYDLCYVQKFIAFYRALEGTRLGPVIFVTGRVVGRVGVALTGVASVSAFVAAAIRYAKSCIHNAQGAVSVVL